MLYVELDIRSALRHRYHGASNAVLLSTILDRAMGPAFFDHWRAFWPRKALPWHRGGELHQSAREITSAPRLVGAKSRHGRICLAAWYPQELVEDALVRARIRASDDDSGPYRRTLHRTLWRTAVDLADGKADPLAAGGIWHLEPETADAA